MKKNLIIEYKELQNEVLCLNKKKREMLQTFLVK